MSRSIREKRATHEGEWMSGLRRRQFKVCLIGDGYVGKTSIRREYLKEGFKRSYIPTLGVDFAQKAIEHEGVQTNLVIWDIAGQSLFENLRRRYYEGSSGLILVYSVIDRSAFDNASKWLVEAFKYMGQLPQTAVIGNKIDLRESHTEDEIVSPVEGRKFSEVFTDRMKIPSVFVETSALTGENIQYTFSTMIEMMLEFTGTTDK